MFLHYLQNKTFTKYIKDYHTIFRIYHNYEKIIDNFTIIPDIKKYKDTHDLINGLKTTLISLITS